MDQSFEVAGVGSVVAGTVVAGAVRVGQRLLLGPTQRGGFAPVTVTGIQRAQARRARQPALCRHGCGGLVKACVCMHMRAGCCSPAPRRPHMAPAKPRVLDLVQHLEPVAEDAYRLVGAA